MKLADAVILRIEQLCIEQNKTKYDLFIASGVPQSTLTSIKKKRSQSAKISTLYAICEGFNISLEEFFHSPLFARDSLIDWNFYVKRFEHSLNKNYTVWYAVRQVFFIKSFFNILMKNKFAVRLSELLQENNISKRKLAREINVSATSISDWSTGKIQPIAENIYLIAEYFQISADYLLGLKDI